MDILYNLGALTLMHLRRYEDAVAALDRALEFAPEFDGALRRKGVVYLWWLGTVDSLRAALDNSPAQAALPQRFYVTRLDRDPAAAEDLLAAAPLLLSQQTVILPRPLLAAWTHRIRGDEEAARAAFEAAETVLDSLWRADSSDYRIQGAMGFVHAGLGRAAEAAASAERYKAGSTQSAGDVYFARGMLGAEAEILAQAGLAERAVGILDRLLSGPGWVTVPVLRIDPIWDPTRSDPGFIALLEKYDSAPGT